MENAMNDKVSIGLSKSDPGTLIAFIENTL